MGKLKRNQNLENTSLVQILVHLVTMLVSRDWKVLTAGDIFWGNSSTKVKEVRCKRLRQITTAGTTSTWNLKYSPITETKTSLVFTGGVFFDIRNFAIILI
jgi:hypothetical protein